MTSEKKGVQLIVVAGVSAKELRSEWADKNNEELQCRWLIWAVC